MNITTVVDPSTDVLVTTVVNKTVSAITHNWQQFRPAHIVLTGGRTGVHIAQTLDTEIFRHISADKSGNVFDLHIWFSDERFTELTDPERTDTKLISAFAKSPKAKNLVIHFHRVSSPELLTLEEAAQEYATHLDDSLSEHQFDAVLLSMGEDGHIASLFPGLDSSTHSFKFAVAVNNSPKPPAERVSISVDRLANSSAIYIFALGESKREALVNLLQHHQGPAALLQEAGRFGQMMVATDLKI
jgi:6-phosphogluconolactonase